jgi:hypothetical protein
VYQDLLKKTFPPLRPKQYFPPASIQTTIHTQPGLSYSQVTSRNLPASSSPAPVPPPIHPPQYTTEITALTTLVKNLFDKMDTMLNLLISVVAKLK